MKDIERLREVRARERPAPQDFLRALVNINDDDAGIGMSKAPRAIAKARVQCGQFEPLHEFENGRWTLAYESKHIE
jgi:hypothetical protein